MGKLDKNKILKIAIVGPECTGKSDLAKHLANHFGTAWVPEYARTYLENINRPYIESDLVKIAQGQIRIEDQKAIEAREVLICDTNLLVIKIWSEFKYNRCDERILNLLDSRTYDLHLLTDIDIPWEADGQREHPNSRKELYSIYKGELDSHNNTYIKISGGRQSRIDLAIRSISTLLKKNE